MDFNKQELADKFARVTGCNEKKAMYHTERYIKTCISAMIADRYSLDASSNYYINATEMDATLSSIMVRGVRHYVWSTFQSFNERIFVVVKQGDNFRKKLTMANSQYSLDQLLDVILECGTPQEFYEEVYRPFDGMPHDLIPINIDSLTNYIDHEVNQLNVVGKLNPKIEEKINRNIKHARKILKLAIAGNGYMKHVIKDGVFGRKYYIGPNLQSAPKAVRNAALGDCWEYDLQCNVYAWKLDLVKRMMTAVEEIINDPEERGSLTNSEILKTTFKLPCTIEYVDSKNAVRVRLAQQIFDTTDQWAINIVKEFITAIGFGASRRAGGYYNTSGQFELTALPKIITSKERLDRALNNSWVVEFISEQDRMNNYIKSFYELYIPDSSVFTIEEVRNSKGDIKKNSMIAYLYQQAERKLIESMIKQCDNKGVLLTVHDCFYTRKQIIGETLLRVNEAMKECGGEYKLGKPEQHIAWKKKQIEDPVDKSDPTYDHREQTDWSKKFRRRSGEDFYQPSDEEQEQINMEMAAIRTTEMIDEITGRRMYAN
ncbi:MAG: hypothetical protein RI886_1223 [Pseudomonadota bacterium]|jgi:hypothetical protein